jgi:hypothetical protein
MTETAAEYFLNSFFYRRLDAPMTPGHTHKNISVVFTPAKSGTYAIKTGRIIERASKIS